MVRVPFGPTRAAVLATALLLAAPADAQTTCGQYDFAGPYTEAFLNGEEFADAPRAAERILDMADGACHQDEVLARLKEALGGVVGYKAAATSAGAQSQLGLDGPVLGVLLEGMLKDDGAEIAIDDGARMIVELDLLARVGHAAINEATTREEALAAIDAFVPFVELGDLMVPKGSPITGPLLQAMNAGARLGAVGEPVPVSGMSVEALAGVTGALTVNGDLSAEVPATALLGHPLDAVLWIAKAARERNMSLKEGDLLSLGSLGAFQMAMPGTVEARYEGFGDAPASVSLTLR